MDQRILSRGLLLVSLLVLLITAPAWSGTITISPGQSIAAALAGMHAGDTLLLRGGTYHEIVTTGFPSGTSWDNAVTMTGAPGESVTIEGYLAVTDGQDHVPKYVVLQDFTIDASPSCQNCNGLYIQAGYVRVQRLEIKNYNNMGIQSYHSDHIELLNNRIHHTLRGSCPDGCTHGMYVAFDHSLIDGNEVWDNAGYGIQMYCSGCQGENHDNIVRNNYVHDNGVGGNNNPGGMTINGGPHLVYNNVVVHTHGGGSGIDLTYQATGTEVYHNTVVGNTAYGIAAEGSGSGLIVRNNIVYGNSNGNIQDPRGQMTVDHNLTSDPSFVNAGGGDFHLQAGSAAIDAGMDLGDKGNGLHGDKDHRGRPVGGWDLGAYEFGSQGNGPPDEPPGKPAPRLPAPTDLTVVFVP